MALILSHCLICNQQYHSCACTWPIYPCPGTTDVLTQPHSILFPWPCPAILGLYLALVPGLILSSTHGLIALDDGPAQLCPLRGAWCPELSQLFLSLLHFPFRAVGQTWLPVPALVSWGQALLFPVFQLQGAFSPTMPWHWEWIAITLQRFLQSYERLFSSNCFHNC